MPYSRKEPIRIKGSPQGEGPGPANQQSQGKGGTSLKQQAGAKRTE